ncbi:MAG: acyl--CoA ligase [Alphaproteobacteria bacterium]|nr:acyl--CoA ligase [Alphaproteobacteria bacterium]
MQYPSFGITQEMIATYSDIVFDLSNNIQRRRGDPVRRLDYAEIERQRPGTGMSDIEIARRIGLTEYQVRYIRMFEESRRFDINQYQKLYALGGGRRYRGARYLAPEDRYKASEEAMALKAALAFDPVQVRGFLERGVWSGDTVAGWLAGGAEAHPDAPLMIHDGKTVTYAEALDGAQRIAAGFLKLGLRKGDVVALQLPNTPEYLLTYFGLVLVGIVPALMHVVYGPAELKPLLAHVRAKAIVTGPGPAGDPTPELLDLRSKLPALAHVITTAEVPDGALRWSDIADTPPLDEILDPPVAADPLLLAFTSGTSANPKAVLASNQTALSTIIAAKPLLGLERDDIIMSVASFTHMFGMMVVHWALACGGALLLLPQFRPDRYAELLEKGKPDVLFTAPAHVAACLQAGLLENKDLSSIRTAIFSGAICPPKLAAQFEAVIDGKVQQMYGMTEAMCMAVTRPRDAKRVRHGGVGRAIPGQELRVRSPDGAPLSPGEEGELQVRGGAVLGSYLDNAEATRAAFADGRWFRTGDLGSIDEKGNVTISGRLKDVVNRGGVKINPTDIEAAIDRHPAVAVSAIVAAPDDLLGERLSCFVELMPGTALNLADLCKFLEQEGVPKRRWPEYLEFVEAMPLTPTRKVIKGNLPPTRAN